MFEGAIIAFKFLKVQVLPTIGLSFVKTVLVKIRTSLSCYRRYRFRACKNIGCKMLHRGESFLETEYFHILYPTMETSFLEIS